MVTPLCPGQDQQFWKPEDIFDVRCPHCGKEMEFWKDDPILTCPDCNEYIRNPKLDTGCAAWCKYADDCLGEPIPKKQNSSG